MEGNGGRFTSRGTDETFLHRPKKFIKKKRSTKLPRNSHLFHPSATSFFFKRKDQQYVMKPSEDVTRAKEVSDRRCCIRWKCRTSRTSFTSIGPWVVDFVSIEEVMHRPSSMGIVGGMCVCMCVYTCVCNPLNIVSRSLLYVGTFIESNRGISRPRWLRRGVVEETVGYSIPTHNRLFQT